MVDSLKSPHSQEKTNKRQMQHEPATKTNQISHGAVFQIHEGHQTSGQYPVRMESKQTFLSFLNIFIIDEFELFEALSSLHDIVDKMYIFFALFDF